MAKNLIIVILMTIILTLLIPLTTDLFSIERAFTYDNFIRVNLTTK
ncbi:MAG TPA: hypothetical protein VFC73_03535 [Syntrophomonadaceae bacterium]|nr:hypothetical protein [Syntrophomonadaceae bacterium]